ncbi:hypothetical protein AOC36_04130 [Erysipelothrix larvae]|uniref:Uncharacterized protein n=1 Tax=Erysipelothrix larvae TaxID=1514105 RepID=A0A0X8GZA7_9FIRM|nr:hypothetical protein [Erysipelothrix larvae]AMC93188.1 hypothetical protein AOC36_04130 [Erysipelothrix larvae]
MKKISKLVTFSILSLMIGTTSITNALADYEEEKQNDSTVVETVFTENLFVTQEEMDQINLILKDGFSKNSESSASNLYSVARAYGDKWDYSPFTSVSYGSFNSDTESSLAVEVATIGFVPLAGATSIANVIFQQHTSGDNLWYNVKRTQSRVNGVTKVQMVFDINRNSSRTIHLYRFTFNRSYTILD